MTTADNRWFKFRTGMMDHPKLVRLCNEAGLVGFAYYVGSLAYSAANGTDGRIYPRSVETLPLPFDLSLKDRHALAKVLVRLALWEEDGDSGYVIHNWRKWQAGYKGAGQSIETYEPPAWLDSISPGVGITNERQSGSSVREKDLNNSFFLSGTSNTSSSARGTNARADAPPRSAPTHARGDRLCTDCGLPHGLHTEDCRYRTGPVGLGTFPDSSPLAANSSPPSGQGEGPSRRCPVCGVGWGIGHAEGCTYDSKRPLLTSVPDSDNLSRAMDNSGRARALRERLRSGSLHEDEHGSPQADRRGSPHEDER